MSVDERLRHVTLKVGRARQQIAELDRELTAFHASNPYKIGTKRLPESQDLVYYVTSVAATPESLALIAGDVVQNLRSALDHLAYQIVSADNSGLPPKPNKIYFPIADNSGAYEARKRSQMTGAHQDTFDAIDAIKPYKGGTDDLWQLHALNNIEKHRLLFTVGSQAGGVPFGRMFAEMLAERFLAEGSRSGAESAANILQDAEAGAMDELLFLPSDRGFPLRAGFELFNAGPVADPKAQQPFRFQVVLDEPGIVQGEPLLRTVDRFATVVEGVVQELTSRLK